MSLQRALLVAVRVGAGYGAVSARGLSLSAARAGKRNFRKFTLPNKRGSRIHKAQQAGPEPELPVESRGARETGYWLEGRYNVVPEMIPELIVPDLTDCQLKPYVSYKAEHVIQSQFTSQQLFDAIYSKKVVQDYKEGKLDARGCPLSPSEEEKLEPEEAVARARKTGSDIF